MNWPRVSSACTARHGMAQPNPKSNRARESAPAQCQQPARPCSLVRRPIYAHLTGPRQDWRVADTQVRGQAPRRDAPVPCPSGIHFWRAPLPPLPPQGSLADTRAAAQQPSIMCRVVSPTAQRSSAWPRSTGPSAAPPRTHRRRCCSPPHLAAHVVPVVHQLLRALVDDGRRVEGRRLVGQVRPIVRRRLVRQASRYAMHRRGTTIIIVKHPSRGPAPAPHELPPRPRPQSQPARC